MRREMGGDRLQLSSRAWIFGHGAASLADFARVACARRRVTLALRCKGYAPFARLRRKTDGHVECLSVREGRESEMKPARSTHISPDDEWPPARLRGVRVLVVDDDPDERDFLVALLGAAAADVRSASSTAEALAMLAWWWPSVLLSDIGMQDGDGYTLIRAVRSMRRDRAHQLPAAAVTGHATTEDRTRALGAGYHAHLAKPVDPDRLIAVVADLAHPSSGQVAPTQ